MSDLEMNDYFEPIVPTEEQKQEEPTEEQKQEEPTEEQKQEEQRIISEINNKKEKNEEIKALYDKYSKLKYPLSRILREINAYEQIKNEENQELKSLMELSFRAGYCPFDIVQDKESYETILTFEDTEGKEMVQFFLGIGSKASDCVEDYEFFIELKNSPESSLKNLQLAYIRNYEHNNTNDSKSRPSDFLSDTFFEKIVEFGEEYIEYAQSLIKENKSMDYHDVYTEVATKSL